MGIWLCVLAIVMAIAIAKSLVELSEPEMAAPLAVQQAPAPAPAPVPRRPAFTARVRQQREITADGSPLDVLVLETQGGVGRGRWAGLVRIGATDESDPAQPPQPVLAAIPVLCAPDSNLFEARSLHVFGSETIADRWVVHARVPVDALCCAQAGARRLCFFFAVSDVDREDLMVAETEVEVDLQAPTCGYLDLGFAPELLEAPLAPDQQQLLRESLRIDAELLQDTVLGTDVARGMMAQCAVTP